MNERIKQLAEQAVEETQLLMIMEYRNFESTLYKKFAQLIVKECASRVDNILREKKDGGGTMGDDIREHFGVDE